MSIPWINEVYFNDGESQLGKIRFIRGISHSAVEILGHRYKCVPHYNPIQPHTKYLLAKTCVLKYIPTYRHFAHATVRAHTVTINIACVGNGYLF